MLGFLYICGRPFLFSLDPERAHELTLSLAARTGWLARLLAPRSPQVPARLGELELRSPVGLAAGLDKNAVALPVWEALGFGFVEIGTVTPRPQVGNPRPRVHRIKAQRALINAMGFPNEGAEAIGARLERLQASGRWPKIPVGVNLGKNKDTPDAEAASDYAKVAKRLAELSSYLVINVSSPNTPGLRALQAKDELARILAATQAEAQGRPVWIKLSPDLGDEALGEAVEVARAGGAAGLIATNTTITRPVTCPDLRGGFSGHPIYPLSKGRITALLERAGDLPVVGVGGVDSPERARELLAAGCTAVQLYTGLIYQGPILPSRINRGLRKP
ncbi:MAG: quinone-dependent dihydroorotate dehydrogenase [Planctomycetes bacterium]|nr:quinone-dependent dihydroorotate dehydrogenase [Planctomycetota bacterium]